MKSFRKSFRLSAFAALAALAGTALAADVTYTEPPANTSMIKVAGGTTTVAGLEAYSHLTHYWSFDDADDPYADSVGDVRLSALKSDDPVWKSGEDAKRGGAMWTGQGLKAATNFIDGKHPFTICFWYKYGNFAVTASRGQESLLHIGKVPKKDGEQISDIPYVRVSHHNTGSPTTIDIWNNQIPYANSKITDFTSNVWHHIALVCTVVEAPDCATSNRFTVYRNGSASAARITVAQQDFELTDKFLLGMGYHYNSSTRAVYDATFDEVMCFDRALTADELKAFAACGAPPDFSAGWDIAADGTLKLQGHEPLTAIRGHGVCETVEPVRLVASSNDWFSGTISAPGFAFAGDEDVKQGLLGTNAWTGATKVESGTLEIVATPMQLFGDALVAWYPFEDATNPGRDFSPRGNNLDAETGFNWSISPDTKSVLQIGNVMEVAETEKTNVGLVSGGRLKGFASGEDNSFTLACWMRSDKCYYRGGLFAFGSSTGFRRNGKDNSSYFGDTNAMIPPSGTIWSTGVWHHWTMVYDAVAAAAGETCYFLFKDGVLNTASAKKNTTFNHATQEFRIKSMSGGSENGEYSHFVGAVDEMIVLNTGNTNDVAKLYALRRAPTETATGVLPTGTTVTVDEGATLSFASANETISGLYGVGNLYLDEFSILRVTDKYRFKGQVLGGGQLIVDPAAEPKGISVLVR